MELLLSIPSFYEDSEQEWCFLLRRCTIQIVHLLLFISNVKSIATAHPCSLEANFGFNLTTCVRVNYSPNFNTLDIYYTSHMLIYPSSVESMYSIVFSIEFNRRVCPRKMVSQG
jgi:hypothetical protein